MVVLVLFQWHILSGVGNVTASAMRVSFLSEAFPVLLAVGFLSAATRLGGDWQFAALVGIPLLAVSGALFVNVLTRVAPAPAGEQTEAATPGSPDVVLLILDAYTRDDVLSDRFGFDNSPFLAELETLDFTVARQAQSNYNYTYAAISTMLDLDYVFDIGEMSDADHEAMRNALAGDPELFRRFRERGYEVAYTQNFWAGSNCGGAVDLCWRDGLTEGALWSLGWMTILAPLLPRFQAHPFHTLSVDHLEALPEIVANGRREGVPRLTVALVILPHQPLLLDADCNPQSGPGRGTLTVSNPDYVEPRRGYYVEQITRTNRMVVAAFTEIINNRNDTIIMVTADRGSDSTSVSGVSGDWSEAEIVERMSILSAYRLPACDVGIYQSITPVNGIRAVTNCALDAGLADLPDRHMWVPAQWVGTVTDIAPRLGI